MPAFFIFLQGKRVGVGGVGGGVVRVAGVAVGMANKMKQWVPSGMRSPNRSQAGRMSRRVFV